MTKIRCRGLLPGAAIALFTAAAVVQPAAVLAAEPNTARITVGATATAIDFLDAMGIGVHWEQRTGAYSHRAELVSAIARLGIRHVRGFDQEMSPVLARRGITSTLVAGPEMGMPQDLVATVKTANKNQKVIDAIEGPNEADLFWPMHGYSYKGQGFPAGVLAYQADLYTAFKSAGGQSDILIIGPSLGKTYDPAGGSRNPLPPGSLTQAVDLGNFHPYPFGGNSFSDVFQYGGIERYYWNGNFPSVNIDAYPYATDVYSPPFNPHAMAATETGYATWRNGISETVQAIYLPRLFAEYFRLGIKRTYIYEMADNQPDPSGDTMNDHFGLLRNDLSPKPAFEALRALTSLLGAAALRRVTAATPVVTLTAHMPADFDRTEFVHSLLLRASNAQSFLLVWHEIANANTATRPPREIRVPDGSLDIETAAPYRADAWYGYGADWAYDRHDVAAGGGRAITVPLQDKIVVVSLRSSDEPAP